MSVLFRCFDDKGLHTSTSSIMVKAKDCTKALTLTVTAVIAVSSLTSGVIVTAVIAVSSLTSGVIVTAVIAVSSVTSGVIVVVVVAVSHHRCVSNP